MTCPTFRDVEGSVSILSRLVHTTYVQVGTRQTPAYGSYDMKCSKVRIYLIYLIYLSFRSIDLRNQY